MKTVHKFPLWADAARVQMPAGARVLAVQIQNGVPCLWAEVDTEQQLETRIFRTVGTGHELGDGLVYVGTYQMPPLVFHVFEVLP